MALIHQLSCQMGNALQRICACRAPVELPVRETCSDLTGGVQITLAVASLGLFVAAGAGTGELLLLVCSSWHL